MFKQTKHIFFTLCLLLSGSLAAQITITGLATFGPDGGGFPGWGIDLIDAEGVLIGQTVTDDLGQFSFELDPVIDGPTTWSVQAIDICNGDIVEVELPILPDQAVYTVLLELCANIDPPPPSDSCQAFIGAEVNPDNSLEYFFSSLSSSIEPIDSYFWDFGDGNDSNEENPTHLYETGGFYDVSLTITAGNCTSTTSIFISVFNPEDCTCPTVIDPVCVIDYTGMLITFDNACLAICAGYPEDHFYDWSNDCFCPTFYAPVCVLSEGDTLTFDNHCFAECEGFGPDSWIDCGPPPPPCNCDDVPFDPVCLDFAGISISFNNVCEALCQGLDSMDIDLLVPCTPDSTCNCFEIYDPVCVIGPDGDIITYPNSCYAECDGFGADSFVDCNPVDTCGCEDAWQPVCVLTDDGVSISFDNECLAICNGYTADQFVICDPCPYDFLFGSPLPFEACAIDTTSGDTISFESLCEAFFLGYSFEEIFPCGQQPDTCVCPEIYDPVCVLDPTTGGIFTFSNSCFAECYGFTADQFIDCEPNDPCNCGHDYLPVCVQTDDGSQITFENECQAICAGYSADNFVLCDPCPFDEIFGELSVCGFDDAGNVITFASICEALFLGYGLESLFPCDDQVTCFADFSVVPVSDNGLTLQFTNLSGSTSGNIVDWIWNFGDGSSSSINDPEYTFAAPGIYEVSLTIWTDDGCSATYTETIIVGENDDSGPTGLECQAFFFFEQPDPDDLLTYQFIDFSLGGNESWIWDFGDGTTSFEQNPLHTFAEEGTYNVSLTVVTASGCETTVIIVVNAGENIWYGDLTCRAWFLPIIVTTEDEAGVYFLNLSSYDAISYAWSYGDGTGSSEFQEYHVFPGDGTYTISLTIETESGCENTFTVTLTIGGEDEGFVSDPTFRTLNSTSTSSPTALDQLSVLVSPNPTRGELRVNWRASKSGTYTYQLLDLNGRQLLQDRRQVVVGENQLDLQLGQAPAGIYLLRLQTPDGVETVRISKQN